MYLKNPIYGYNNRPEGRYFCFMNKGTPIEANESKLSIKFKKEQEYRLVVFPAGESGSFQFQTTLENAGVGMAYSGFWGETRCAHWPEIEAIILAVLSLLFTVLPPHKLKSPLLTLALLAITFTIATPTLAADNEAIQARFLKRLEANVDLRKPSGSHRQSIFYMLDQSGREVAKLDYETVQPFSNGMARVAPGRDSYIGYIDVQGRLLITPKFLPAEQFSEDLAWVCPASKVRGFIDLSGKQVIADKDFFGAKSFSEGLAPVRVRTAEYQKDNGRTEGDNMPGKFKYIDKSGKTIIAPQFDDANQFHQGLAAVKLAKEWFFINKQGASVSEKYVAVGAFSEGLAPVQIAGKWGYISPDGKVKIAAQFEEAGDFSDGLARIKTDGQYGFINADGAIAIKAVYKSVDNFSQQICAVQMVDGKWGYIDKLGTIIVPAIYETAKAFSGGRALIVLNDLYGYIDAQGKYVVEPKYDHAFSYTDKRAIVSRKNWDHPMMKWILMAAHMEPLKPHNDSTSPTGIYIPQNLDDAFKELDALLPAAARADIKLVHKDKMSIYHHGLGMWLRNNWGLWKGLRLAQYFKALGFTHPDDMSSALLNAYWSRLHGQKSDIAKQAAEAKEYWDKLRPIVNSK